MSNEFQEASEIPNPRCIKCGKPTTQTVNDMGTTVYQCQNCTTPDVIFDSEEEGEQA